MKPSFARIQAAAAAATLFAAASSSRAQLLYSFETLYNAGTPAGPNGNPPAVPPAPDPNGTRPDDFHFNGGGTTATQDTIGATDQSNSLKVTQVAGQTFSGAITELLPSNLNNPNSYISMDVTIPSTGNFVGNFARLGISEFGNNSAQGITGAQVQSVTQDEANIDLQPGTYHIGVPLIAINNPITFDTNVPFSQVFGDDPDTQLTPAGWEIYVNKSSETSLTIYIDNVRIEKLIPGDDNFDGKVNAADFDILAANYGGSGKVLAQGDLNGDFNVDVNDFNILAANFNTSTPQLGVSLGTLVPEPGSFVSLAGLLGAAAMRRQRAMTVAS